MCLTNCIQEKRINKKKKKLQEQMNLMNEVLTARLNELKQELKNEIQALEISKTKEEFIHRINNIESILAHKSDGVF